MVYHGDRVRIIGGYFRNEIAVVGGYDAAYRELNLRVVGGMTIRRDIGNKKYGGVQDDTLPPRRDSKSFSTKWSSTVEIDNCSCCFSRCGSPIRPLSPKSLPPFDPSPKDPELDYAIALDLPNNDYQTSDEVSTTTSCADVVFMQITSTPSIYSENLFAIASPLSTRSDYYKTFALAEDESTAHF